MVSATSRSPRRRASGALRIAHQTQQQRTDATGRERDRFVEQGARFVDRAAV
jgi:hypothetical protein